MENQQFRRIPSNIPFSEMCYLKSTKRKKQQWFEMNRRKFLSTVILMTLLVIPVFAIFSTPAKAQGVTLKIIVTSQQKPGVTGIVDDFVDATDGVDAVEVIASGDRADDQLTYLITQMSGESDEFDVIGLDPIWTAQFAENEWIEDLSAAPYSVESTEMEDYFGGMVEASTYEGSYWAYPYFMNLGVMFYRKDLLDKYGYTVDDLATWTDFKDTVNDILEQEDDDDLVGLVGQYDAYEGGVCNFIEWMGSGGQTSIFDEDGNVDLNNSNVQDTMDFLHGLVAPRYTGVVDTDYIIPRDALTMDEGSSVGKWTAGEAVVMRQWTFAYGSSIASSNLNATNGPGNYTQFGMGAMPTKSGATGAKSSVVGGAVLGISAYSQNKELAMELIRFLGDTDAQEFELTEVSNFPALKSVFDSPPTDFEWIADFKAAAESTLSRPVHPKYSEFSVEIAQKFNQILGGSETVEEGLGEMEKNIEDIIAGGATEVSGIPGYTLAFLVLTAISTIGIIAWKHRK